MKIADRAMVTLRCTVHDEAGRVLDDGSKALAYQHGCGMLLAGLEQAIAGATAGQSITVELGPEQAYGAYREELIFEAVREHLPQVTTLEPGMTLRSTGGPFPLTVMRLTESGAVLDGNYPLAGRTLRFQVEVIDVEPAAHPVLPPSLARCTSAASCSEPCSGACPT